MIDFEPQLIELKYTHGDTEIIHKMSMDGLHYNEAMQAFINFLRGIGYIIPDEEDRV